MLKLLVIGLSTVLFLNLSHQNPAFAGYHVTPELLGEIQRKCLEAYPKDLLDKLTTSNELDGIKVKKGNFGASNLEDVVEFFALFLKPGKSFIDLGSGDGRVVFLASLFGVEATGIEYEPALYRISIKALKALSNIIDAKKIHLIKGDFFSCDFSLYDIIYCYEGSGAPASLRKKLSEEMKPGSVLIKYGYSEINDEKFDLIQESPEKKICIYRKAR